MRRFPDPAEKTELAAKKAPENRVRSQRIWNSPYRFKKENNHAGNESDQSSHRVAVNAAASASRPMALSACAAKP